MAGTASVSGLISGLDTDGIISKLMDLERQPITRLQAKQETLNAKLKAWQDANTRMLALKTKSDALSSGTALQAKAISSSDESILRGTVVTGAQDGVYYVKVNAVARADQEKSIGFADTNTTRVGTGSISITVGTGAAKVITIDDSNNTLAGLKDAINRAGAGVTANIINDGDPLAPNRLIITSKTTGIAGEVTIDTVGLTGGTAPTFTTMQAAQDASVTLGEGAGALTVTRSSNEFTGLIPGVTFSLQSADTTKTIAVTVKSDTASIKQAIKDFVDQYNNLMDFINEQFKYNTATNTGGTLFSDSDLQLVHSDIVGKMFMPVGDMSQKTRLLSQIGITSTTSNNKLTIDDTALDQALSSNLAGVTELFSMASETTDSAIAYIASTSKTKLPGTGGYAIEISALATQTRLTASGTQTGNLAQDETLTINGKTVQLTMNMTPDEVLAAINARSSVIGVTASRVGDALTLTSNSYGSTKTIIATSNVSSGGSGLGVPQSRVTAGASQTQSLAMAETLTINGHDIHLTGGMTPDQVIKKINDSTSVTGVVASRTGADGQGTGSYLTLTGALPGQSVTAVSTVSNGGGTPSTKTTGLGTVQVTESASGGETGTGTGATGSGTVVMGTDVAGTIGGEAATGSGQMLTGNAGNANTDGLQIKVTTPTTGSHGVVRFSKGLGSIVSDYLSFVTAAGTGVAKTAQDLIQTEIKDATTYMAALEERIAAKKDRITLKFAMMESALARLKGEGDYIASQVQGFNANWKK